MSVTLYQLPGAEALILHFKSLGLPTAIATGSAQVSYRKKVTNYGHLFDWMSHVVCSDDPEVKRGKPAPDIYHVAAARFKTPPQSCANVSNSSGKRYYTHWHWWQCSYKSFAMPLSFFMTSFMADLIGHMWLYAKVWTSNGEHCNIEQPLINVCEPTETTFW